MIKMKFLLAIAVAVKFLLMKEASDWTGIFSVQTVGMMKQ